MSITPGEPHPNHSAGEPLAEELLTQNPDDVHDGAANLRKQIGDCRRHGISSVVAVNTLRLIHASA